MEKPWKVIVAFIGVFIAGSVFGALLALRLNKQRELQLPPRYVVQPVPQTPSAQATPPATATSAAGTPAQTQATTPQGQVAGVRPNPNSASAVAPTLPPTMAVQAPPLMRRYVDKLDLTPEQKERVNPLIVRATNDIRRQQQTNLRETGVILAHLQEDISRELTPAQRAKLEDLTERQRVFIEQRERQQQELLRQQQMDKAEKRKANKDTKDGNIKSKSGKPPEDGNN